MIDILQAGGKSPKLYFFNSQIRKKLIIDAGYISMGLIRQEWILSNELDEPVLKILLPKLALKLHRDIFISLRDDPFEILEIYKRKIKDL